MTPQTYTMQPVVRGDRWSGIPSITILVNGAPPVVALASARLQFRASKTTNAIGAALTTADASMVIVDAAGWELMIPPQNLPLSASPSTWYWDLETTDTAGSVKTYVSGTLPVLQDITR